MHDRETGLPQKGLNAPFPQPPGEPTLPFDATRNVLRLPVFFGEFQHRDAIAQLRTGEQNKGKEWLGLRQS